MLSLRAARRLAARRVDGRLVAMAVAVSAMVACSGGAPDTSPSTPVDSPMVGEEGTKVVGVAESVDDVGSQTRVPMPDGALLVLPNDQADRLWGIVEHTPSESELPYVGGLLDDADVEPWELVTIEDGRFGLDVADGAYLVCLLSGEYLLEGCGEAMVAGPTTWSVSKGEGGFDVR